MTEIILNIHVNVLDRASIEQFAAGIEDVSWPNALATAVCNPEKAPLDTGYEIVRKEVITAQTDNAIVVLAVRVHDAEAVVNESLSRYEECWRDMTWVPESMDEALYEILVASNASPSPADVGFEISTVTYADDLTPLPSLPQNAV